jgi:hypothetical protein
MELWTHPGSLAEAMRAARPTHKLTPPAKCAASMDTCLILYDGATVALDGKVRVYSIGKKEYARMWIARGKLVVEFEGPKAGAGDKAKYYRPVPGKKGWLRYTRPATGDPIPDLVADLGTILGTAAFERRNK